MIISKIAALLLDQNNGIVNFHLPQRGTTPFGFVFHIMHAKKTGCKIPTFVVILFPSSLLLWEETEWTICCVVLLLHCK